MTVLFPPGKGGGSEVEYGYKGKGILNHILVEGKGYPLAWSTTAANGSEREEAEKLIEQRKVKSGKPGRPKQRPKKIACDKGYDSKELRQKFRSKGIKPEIPKRKWQNKAIKGRPLKKTVGRFIVERCFAWMQRKYRRLVVRWERISDCYKGFVSLGLVHFWSHKIIFG